MKRIATILSLALFTLSFTACKKDKDDKGFVMEGIWEGKIGTGPAIPNSQYAIRLKPGGVIERINSGGTASATGTWQLNNKTFTALYTFTSGGTVVTLTGTFNEGLARISGTWVNDGGEEGSWHVTKE